MKQGGGHGGGGVWIFSYADMVTLLLAFFIVMYTMSQIDINKLKALVGSLNGAFDPKPPGAKLMPTNNQEKIRKTGQASMVPGGSASVARVAPANGVQAKKGPGKEPKPSRAERNLEEVAKQVQEMAKASGLEKQVKTTITPRGTVVSFAETADGLANVVPFASGSAELTPGFKQFLDKVAPLLASITNKIEVQGHTDRRPIRTPAFPSNWELSGARAGSVVRYFCTANHLAQNQFVCSGFADTVPADPGDNPSAWARNRRIEIVITRNPVAVYDSMTRDQATTAGGDITQPLGPTLFDLNLPKPADAEKPKADGANWVSTTPATQAKTPAPPEH